MDKQPLLEAWGRPNAFAQSNSLLAHISPNLSGVAPSLVPTRPVTAILRFGQARGHVTEQKPTLGIHGQCAVCGVRSEGINTSLLKQLGLKGENAVCSGDAGTHVAQADLRRPSTSQDGG